jgi:UDP-N-acetylglucosamine 2-epimerase (non-hydrolysing)
MKKRILFFIGTRPEAIKIAPVIKEFKKNEKQYEVLVCNTGQHLDLIQSVINFFDLKIDFDLKIMTENQDLFSLSSNLLLKTKEILKEVSPDLVFVHGDTTTSFICALASKYLKIKVGHIEAGLRTFNKSSPFPEEINRTLTGQLADLHLAPTAISKQNLIREGVSEQNISITGNTVIDALLEGKNIIKKKKFDLNYNYDYILFTGHRRENFGTGFINIFEALNEICLQNPTIKIIYPVHPNPNVKDLANKTFTNKNQIKLIPPQGYGEFIWLMTNAKLIITDSGGIQEEAPSLGKPVLVTRDTTERPEAVERGTVILVGSDKAKIVSTANKLLNDDVFYSEMSNKINPYGDGNASERILEFIKESL